MSARAMLIYVDHLLIRNERGGGVVVARQVSAEDQRRAEDAPQCHHSLLLVESELCGRAAAFLVGYFQFAERKHVGIGPSSVLAHELRPVAGVLELLAQELPVVPEIVGDAPHLRILLEELRLGNRRGPGRDAEHNRAPGLANREAQRFHLGWLIEMAPHVVSLDEVDAPRCVEFRNRIVVSLGSRLRRVNAPHVRIPAARVAFIRNVSSVKGSALDRKVTGDRLPWDPAHDVNSELQALAVHVVRQRLETRTVCRGRKPVHGWHQAAELVHGKRGPGLVVVSLRIRLVPLDVDDNVLPPIFREMLRHPVGVGLDLRFADRGAVGIPTIPAHRRSRSRGRINGVNRSCQYRKNEDAEKSAGSNHNGTL